MTNVGENTRFLRLEVINLACFPAQNSWAAAALTVIPEVHEVGDSQEAPSWMGWEMMLLAEIFLEKRKDEGTDH